MKFRRSLKTGLILSLLFHALVATFLILKPETPRQKEQVISMEIVESEPLKPVPNLIKKSVDKKAVSRSKERQIVEQNEKSINDDVPTKDYYLGQHNQTVIQQTRAQNQGRFENKQTEASSKKPSTAPQKIATETTRKPRVSRSLDVMPDGLPTLEALKPKFNWDIAKQNHQRARGHGKASDASKTDDYIKDVDTGVQTLLSTREFVYYSYYNRIKRQLAQYWEPKIKEKIRHIFALGRRIASDQDRITRLLIILDNQGVLVGVKVIEDSGVSDLDDAAIEAFREAAPFPNPPKGIIEKDGTIKIRWDFVLEA